MPQQKCGGSLRGREMAEEQPIIVIKKKGGHGGHHGGAWKVAYADFVTAMMSLFIVLWLMNSTPKPVQEEIAGYFNDPKGTAAKKGSDGKPIPKEIKTKETKESKEAKEAQNKKDMDELKNQLLRAIEDVNVLNKLKKQIEITLTDEGLRIELVEDEKGTFFESGSAQPTPALQEILKVLAERLKTLPNRMSIEGHTDAQPYIKQAAYGNWELSTDRANVARREMQQDGVRADQVFQVRGFADQQLHIPEKPLDPANRRVSLVVLNLPANVIPEKIAHVEPARNSPPRVETAGAKTTEKEKVRPVLTTAENTKETDSKSEGKKNVAVVEDAGSTVPPIAKRGASEGMLLRVKGFFQKRKG